MHIKKDKNSPLKLKKIVLTILVLILSSPSVILAFKADTADRINPVITDPVQICGNFQVSISDFQNIRVNDSTYWVDEGVFVAPYFTESQNLSDIELHDFKKDSANHKFSVTFHVIDPYSEAKGVLWVKDKPDQDTTYNYSSIKISYIPPLLEIFPDTLNGYNFGNKLVGSTTTSDQVKINSVNDVILKVSRVYLLSGRVFKMINMRFGDSTVSKIKTMYLQIQYIPDREFTDSGQPDYDTLVVENCLTYKIPLQGSGIIPKIYASDFDFGLVKAGDTVLINSTFYPDSGDGLKISNIGTGNLLLKSYTKPDTSSGFFIPVKHSDVSSPINNNIPFRFITVGFSRTTPGEYFGQIVWSSNGHGIDSISKFRAIVYDKGPYVSSCYFKRALVKSQVSANVVIRNSGDKPVIITGFKLDDSTGGNFKIIPDDYGAGIELVPDSYLSGTKEISVGIIFSPQTEFEHETKIYPIFAKPDSAYNGKIFNNIIGFGYLPKVKVTGYDWVEATKINNQNTITGYAEIASVSQSADLHLVKIEWANKNVTKPGDFRPVNEFPSDDTIPMGKSLYIGFNYKPTVAGDRYDTIRVITNAVDGSNPNIVLDTTYFQLHGTAFNPIVQAVPTIFQFEPIKNCDQDSGTVCFFNSSPNVTAYIYDIAMRGNDTSAFSVDKSALVDADLHDSLISIAPRTTYCFKVYFKPNRLVASNYEAECKLYTNVDFSTVLLKASTTIDTLNITGLKIEGQYGMLTKDLPGMLNQYRIFASFYDENVPLNNISFDIVYKPEEIQYTGEIKKGKLIERWDSLTANDSVDGAFHRLHISAKTKIESLLGSGSFIEPVFLVLLSTTDKIVLKIENVKTSLDPCVKALTTDGGIDIVGCGSDLRKVMINGDFFLKIEPSEIHSDMTIFIHYAIAFDANLKIDISNSNGDIISTFNENGQKQGEYKIPVNTTKMVNGKYFVRMICGSYSETQSFIIAK